MCLHGIKDNLLHILISSQKKIINTTLPDSFTSYDSFETWPFFGHLTLKHVTVSSSKIINLSIYFLSNFGNCELHYKVIVSLICKKPFHNFTITSFSFTLIGIYKLKLSAKTPEECSNSVLS